MFEKMLESIDRTVKQLEEWDKIISETHRLCDCIEGTGFSTFHAENTDVEELEKKIKNNTDKQNKLLTEVLSRVDGLTRKTKIDPARIREIVMRND